MAKEIDPLQKRGRDSKIREFVYGKHFYLENPEPVDGLYVCPCGGAGKRGYQVTIVETGEIVTVGKRCLEHHLGIELPKRQRGQRAVVVEPDIDVNPDGAGADIIPTPQASVAPPVAPVEPEAKTPRPVKDASIPVDPIPVDASDIDDLLN